MCLLRFWKFAEVTSRKCMRPIGAAAQCGLLSSILSAFVHLFIISVIIFAAAPAAFDAVIPSDLLLYFAALVFFLIVSLSISGVLGLLVRS